MGMLKENKLDLTTDPKAINVVCLMIGTNGYNVPDLKALVDEFGRRAGKSWCSRCLRRGPNTNSGAGAGAPTAGTTAKCASSIPR